MTLSPALLTALLRAVRATALRGLLPTAGRTGTLAGRMVGTAAEGRVHAKTGTMSGVSALSGYLEHADALIGEVWFALIANNSPQSSAVLRAAQDAIAVAVAMRFGKVRTSSTDGRRRGRVVFNKELAEDAMAT